MFKQGYYEEIGYKKFKEFTNYRQSYKSLASESQISLLLGLIANYKFSNERKIQNVLEIGVYNGVTSLYMLKEGCKNNDNYQQYAIDLGGTDFFGEAVFKEASTEELQHFSLYKNSTALDIENILPQNTKLDLVFIDAGHSHPHPLIDLICVLPFLHEESLVLLHDVVDYMRPNAWGESFIYEYWKFPKYRNIKLNSRYSTNNNIPNKLNNTGIEENIFKQETLGVISIPNDKKQLMDMLLYIANLPFRAAPWDFDDIYLGINEETIERLKDFMLRYYSCDFTQSIIDAFYLNLENYKKEWVLRVHETRFYNYLFEKNQKIEKQISKLEKQVELNKIEIQSLSKKIPNNNNQYTFLERIFSVKNSSSHKVITILGIKIKLNRGV